MITCRTGMFWAAGVAVAVLAFGAGAGAGELGAGQGRGLGRAQRPANAGQGELAGKHIERIEQLIAERPDMPADIKAALEKIVDDLKARNAVIEKIAAGRQAGNKEVGEADRAALRAAVLQLMKDRLTLIDLHLANLEERIKAHADAPADVKAAAEKLLSDRKERRADLAQLIADIEAGNKDAIEADRDEMKDDRQGLRADLQTLKEALMQHRGERRPQAGKGEPK